MSDSGAPASTSAAETASVRGVAFGWAKVAVSMTMPAISAVASAPSPRSSGRPSRTASSATSSQVAAAPGSIQSAAPAPSFDAWWSMIDAGRSRTARVPGGDGPDALRARAVGQDQQVVGPVRVRIACGTGRCRA